MVMARKIFQTSKPACLSATVTDPADREVVERFRDFARASGLSVQRLLLLAVKAFLEAENG